MHDEREDKTVYKVVLNHEEQYSIWPAHRENALGWKDEGKSRRQRRMSGAYQGDMDRYETAFSS